MDGARDYHTKWNKSEKEISYDITYMWNLKKKDTNELIYKTEIDSKNEFTVARGKDGGKDS